MKSIERAIVGVEKMHGFEDFVETLKAKNVELRYGELGDFLTIPDNEVFIGIVKNPRMKMTGLYFQQLTSLYPNIVVSYIGRHIDKVLGPDIKDSYERISSHEGIIHLSGKDIPVTSMEESPLSEAVAAFSLKVSEMFLQNRLLSLDSLTISHGNTFEVRKGHTFKEKKIKEAENKKVAVLGAGDVGGKIINSFVSSGAIVSYTSEKPKTEVMQRAEYRHMEDIFVRSHFDIVSVNLSSGVKVPVEKITDVDLFIHTASGSNVDEDALIKALTDRRIKKAVIDVFSSEGKDFFQSHLYPFFETTDRPEDKRRKTKLQELIAEGRLFLTPHIAYLEPQAIEKTLKLALANMRAISERRGR